MRHLSSHLEEAGHGEVARRYAAQSLDMGSQADTVRGVASDRAALELVQPRN